MAKKTKTKKTWSILYIMVFATIILSAIASATIQEITDDSIITIHYNDNCDVNEGLLNTQPQFNTAYFTQITHAETIGGACRQSNSGDIDAFPTFAEGEGLDTVQNFTMFMRINHSGGNFNWMYDSYNDIEGFAGGTFEAGFRRDVGQWFVTKDGSANLEATGGAGAIPDGNYFTYTVRREIIGTQQNWTVFINGTLIFPSTTNPSVTFGTIRNLDYNFTILGSKRNAGAFGGDIDEFLFLNKSITPDDINLVHQYWSNGTSLPLEPPATLIVYLNGSMSPINLYEGQSFIASYIGDGVTSFTTNETGTPVVIANNSLRSPSDGYFNYSVTDGSQSADNYALVTDVPSTATDLLLNGTSNSRTINLSDFPFTISAVFTNATGQITRNAVNITNPTIEAGLAVGTYTYTAVIPTIVGVQSGSTEVWTLTVQNNTVEATPTVETSLFQSDSFYEKFLTFMVIILVAITLFVVFGTELKSTRRGGRK
jgi:hypothetical protein